MDESQHLKFLFHYTTIEILALILRLKKIRFSRADRVNDLEEIKIEDYPELKKAVFISCWTASHDESIPLWNLYSSAMKGVRIKLPANMFQHGSELYTWKDGKTYIINLYTLGNQVERKKDFLWIPYLLGPNPVIYSNHNIVFIEDKKNIDISKVGTIKLLHWQFEQEYRYLIFPGVFWNPETKTFQLTEDFIQNPIKNVFVDISLKEEVVNNIEVTLGPRATDAEYLMVESLLEKYTTHGKLIESTLKNKIRI